MNKASFLWLIVCILSLQTHLSAQTTYSLTGVVLDEHRHVLEGANVTLNDVTIGTSTDANGRFNIKDLPELKYVLKVHFVGFNEHTDTISINANKNIVIVLNSKDNRLKELVVTDHYRNVLQRESSMSLETVDKHFINAYTSGSLMQTLSYLPGINSMNIGSGQSKPVIRGLGFNRVVVVENGIKHEGQEWGADHGLEIDQFSVERVNIIKGPASLMYGANAIGGVVDIQKISKPMKNTWGANVGLNLQSNNGLLGLSGMYFMRKNKFYLKTNFTLSDYADYRVPTDSIEYMSYYFKLKDNQLRNTAGKDRNGSITFGYLGEKFTNYFTVSDVFSKSGFFANAHGLEIRLSDIDYDKSSRDIDLPYQQVNHLSVVNNSILKFENFNLFADLAFQNNYRKEFAEAVSHGYMPVPPDSLERIYNKNTFSGDIRIELRDWGKHRLYIGLNSVYQHNIIGGWGFMLPDYESFETGTFVYDKIRLSEHWLFNAGARYDFGNIHSKAYYDWYETPTGNGNEYVQRAEALDKSFNNLSWSIGMNYNNEDISARMNIGKSFRMPIAKELASSGINYHYFRFEQGNINLKAEESYQLDFGISNSGHKFGFDFSPFVNYFPNFIYLNPSSDYNNAQQIFYYSQSEVFRAGGELSLNYEPVDNFMFLTNVEYVYSVQLSGSKRGFNLPFAPPFKSIFGVRYTPVGNKLFSHPSIGADLVWAAAQNDIVPPEKVTPGYRIINLTGSFCLNINHLHPIFNIQVQNLFNTKYFDHTSFYRLIEVPAQGRNIVLTIQLPIN